MAISHVSIPKNAYKIENLIFFIPSLVSHKSHFPCSKSVVRKSILVNRQYPTHPLSPSSFLLWVCWLVWLVCCPHKRWLTTAQLGIPFLFLPPGLPHHQLIPFLFPLIISSSFPALSHHHPHCRQVDQGRWKSVTAPQRPPSYHQHQKVQIFIQWTTCPMPLSPSMFQTSIIKSTNGSHIFLSHFMTCVFLHLHSL